MDKKLKQNSHGILKAIGGVHYESTVQAVLTSILQTAKQQGKKPFDVLLELLCGRDKRKILDLVPGTQKAIPDYSRAAKAVERPRPSKPERAVPRELLALHATSPPRGPVSVTLQP